jgi:glycolate oxidase iron-sulfur subunit
LCCGSAGTYSILQPELAGRLRQRKLGNILAAGPDVLASGNIGCLQHLAAGGGALPPIVHIAELLDWAEGGPVPPAMVNSARARKTALS